MKRRDLLKGIAALAALGPTVAKAASHPDVEKPRYEVITLESRFGPSPYSPEREILRERIRNLPEVRDLIERRVLEKIGATEYDFRPLPGQGAA